MFKWFLIFITTTYLFACQTEGNLISASIQTTAFENKQAFSISINGITLEAPPQKIDSSTFINMQRLEAGWVAFVPFAFSRKNDSVVHYNTTGQWWGEREEGIIACINMAHAQHMKVMLKPQIWIGGGEYTGHFAFEKEEDWQKWEKSYLAYIITHAKTAQQYGVEMFCIGTEMDASVKQRPQFWSLLIDSVKKIYTGKLTYAANWSCYKDFSQWDKLDYIGIDAYFPLNDATTPTVENLISGWKPHFNEIKNFTTKINKPVLFTEYGYRSMDKCAFEPWQSYNKEAVNMDAQANAYEALYSVFTAEKWFAGGFIWKWETRDDRQKAATNNNYTPQHKPVEQVIKKWYAQF